MPPPTFEYCFLWIDWWPMCMTKAEWSGWVQAIGAVVAIVAGAVAVWWQVRKTRVVAIEFRRSEDVRILSLIAIANLGCIVALKHAKTQFDESVQKRSLDGFFAHCGTLVAIPLLQIPSPWVAMSVGRAVQERERLPISLGGSHGTQMAILAIDRSLKEFLECERVVGVALAELGGRLPYGRVEVGINAALHQSPSDLSR